jgi:hypothetical protein
MTRPNPSRRRAPSRLAAALAALAASLCLFAADAPAQSGRKAQKPLGLPTEAPKPSDPAAAKAEAKKPEALVSFVVMRADDSGFIDPLARDGVASAFGQRLRQSSAVDVSDGGRGGRQQARERAKKEEKAYVVVLQLDTQAGDMMGGDASTLVIRTFVYAPKTGDLKYTDTIYQRPYRNTARVGGIPVPVPSRRVNRYPSQQELEQGARDAADRVLGRFQITPRDNE